MSANLIKIDREYIHQFVTDYAHVPVTLTDELLKVINLAREQERARVMAQYGIVEEDEEEEEEDDSCDQCEALMINGTYCHETGCPNMHKVKVDGVWVTPDQEEEEGE